MASTTPTYALPYQEIGDSPNGAVGQQNLAVAVEAALAGLDAKIATINNLTNSQSASSTDETGFTSTSFVAGAAPVGVAFTAPASGSVLIHFSAQLQQNINGQSTFVSAEVKTGSTVGSGSLAGSAANSDRALVCGKAVVSSGPALLQATRSVLYVGLTPGAAYNVRLMHCVDGGSGTVYFRDVIVQPQL
jgi:hypothetical protein